MYAHQSHASGGSGSNLGKFAFHSLHAALYTSSASHRSTWSEPAYWSRLKPEKVWCLRGYMFVYSTRFHRTMLGLWRSAISSCSLVLRVRIPQSRGFFVDDSERV